MTGLSSSNRVDCGMIAIAPSRVSLHAPKVSPVQLVRDAPFQHAAEARRQTRLSFLVVGLAIACPTGVSTIPATSSLEPNDREATGPTILRTLSSKPA